MIPREKKPGECDCDWSGSCDEHAFVPPGARRLIEARAHAAGYEAAVRDFWRGACEGLATLDESSSLALVDALSSSTDDDVADGAWALATVLRRRATRLRAWAKEGA